MVPSITDRGGGYISVRASGAEISAWFILVIVLFEQTVQGPEVVYGSFAVSDSKHGQTAVEYIPETQKIRRAQMYILLSEGGEDERAGPQQGRRRRRYLTDQFFST